MVKLPDARFLALDAEELKFSFRREWRLCDLPFFDLAIYSKLRGCDAVKVRIGDLVSGGRIWNRSTVVQQETGGPVRFEIAASERTALLAWLEHRGGTLGDCAFPKR